MLINNEYAKRLFADNFVLLAHHTCVYRVDLAGADDLESRYHIWEAMVALNDMCAKQGKLGTAYGLGQSWDKK